MICASNTIVNRTGNLRFATTTAPPHSIGTNVSNVSNVSNSLLWPPRVKHRERCCVSATSPNLFESGHQQPQRQSRRPFGRRPDCAAQVRELVKIDSSVSILIGDAPKHADYLDHHEKLLIYFIYLLIQTSLRHPHDLTSYLILLHTTHPQHHHRHLERDGATGPAARPPR